jgi:adenylate cyclase
MNLQALNKDSSKIPGSSSLSGSALLSRLLSERNQFTERAADIDKRICDAFERNVAILALDMVGFSRLTVEYGIIHYLAMIHQMQEAALPAVTDNGGTLIKQDADDIFAIYDGPAHALESALDIFRAFEAVNSVVPPERDIYGSIGIGYGETLVVDGKDIFGSEVNIACKLGEDLAGRSEILLTRAAYEALPPGAYVCSPVTYRIGEMEINCYRYDRSHFPGKES